MNEVKRAEDMEREQLAEYAADMMHRMMVHHTLWFREVEHQLGFGRALAEIQARLSALPQHHKILNINSWNEWTESSYLEPDDVWGTGYLDTLREAVVGREAGQ